MSNVTRIHPKQPAPRKDELISMALAKLEEARQLAVHDGDEAALSEIQKIARDMRAELEARRDQLLRGKSNGNK